MHCTYVQRYTCEYIPGFKVRGKWMMPFKYPKKRRKRSYFKRRGSNSFPKINSSAWRNLISNASKLWRRKHQPSYHPYTRLGRVRRWLHSKKIFLCLSGGSAWLVGWLVCRRSRHLYTSSIITCLKEFLKTEQKERERERKRSGQVERRKIIVFFFWNVLLYTDKQTDRHIDSDALVT